ncbi:MAG: VanZ family protein [Chloroflexi bacterium]|nr:VanZ family protein [Chloroflexota bacterium]
MTRPRTRSRPPAAHWLIAAAYMAPAIAWAGVIYAFSSSSSPSIGAVGFEKGQWAPSTVLLHMAEYAILAALLVAGMRLLAARRLGRSVPFQREMKILVLSAFLSVLYGVSDELHQSTVAGRDASVVDVISDAVGAAIAVAAAYGILTLLRTRRVK